MKVFERFGTKSVPFFGVCRWLGRTKSDDLVFYPPRRVALHPAPGQTEICTQRSFGHLDTSFGATKPPAHLENEDRVSLETSAKLHILTRLSARGNLIEFCLRESFKIYITFLLHRKHCFSNTKIHR